MAHRDDSGWDLDHVQTNSSLSGTAAPHATVPRNLVIAKQPNAAWTDQNGPEVDGVEVEGPGPEQQPRTKLMMLANELDAGTIKHRFQVHTLTLDRLRAEAVLELQNEAIQPGPVRKLPGPNADEWFHWACNLQDGQDHAALVELRANFPALECFISRMEESHWIAGKRADVAAIPVDWVAKYETRESDYMRETGTDTAVRSFTAAIPARLFPMPKVGDTSESGNHQRWPREFDEPKVKSESACSTEQAPVGQPEKGEPSAAANNLAHLSHGDPQGQSHDPVLQRLRTIVAQHDGEQENRILESLVQRHVESGEPEVKSETPSSTVQVPVAEPEKGDPPAAADDLAHPLHGEPQGQSHDPVLEGLRTIFARYDSDEESRIPGTLVQRYKAVLVWGAIAGILVLGITFAHPAAVGASKLRAIFVAARTQSLGTLPDSEIQKEVDLKLAALKNSSLRATVESGAVTLAGYTSSQWESLQVESVIARINGVKDVRNQIQVELLPPPNQDSAKHVRRKSAK